MSKSLLQYFVSGLVIIVFGMVIMIGNIHLYTSVISLLVFVFFLHGITQLWSIVKKQEFQKEKFIKSIINVLFAISMHVFPNIPLSIVPILFAFYLLFNGAVKGINSYILFRNGQRQWKDLTLFILFCITGFTFLFAPLGHLSTFLSAIGFYCILIGLSEWKDLLLEILPMQMKKRAIHISLPTFLDAFIPRRMLSKINQYFNEIKLEEEQISKIQKEESIPDLEIFIHVAPHGFNQLGHMDICFDGKVISYGNYDTASYRMFDSIGDGVLFETNKESYIPFCIQQSNKTLICFGLKLTKHQKEKVRKEIERVKKNTYIWKTQAEIDQKNGEQKERKFYTYIDLLYLKTGAVTYKFHLGEFKTYFVLGRNCTLFADRIVGKSGTDILKMVGIITPGAYLDYLEHEFLKKNSMVICRTIYNERTRKKYFKK